MTLQHKYAIVRKPGKNFAHGVTASKLGSPNFEKALEQHAAYVAALEHSGVEVICLPADEKHPDGCFVEDTAILAEGTAIITNPGHQSRKGETGEVEKALRELITARGAYVPLKQIEHITAPGTVDGGDVLRIKDHYIIGLSNRTNKEGAEQLGKILTGCRKTFAVVQARDLHLKTSVAYLGNDCCVVTEEYDRDEEFSKALGESVHRKIVVSEDEKYAANCLRVNETLLLASGFPQIFESLTSRFKALPPEMLTVRVVTLDMSEFQKMDGGLTCLSLLI
jgi:N-Dimethylarginine dimethylaminohydrolase